MQNSMNYEKVIEYLELYPRIDGNIQFLRKCIKNLNDEYYTPLAGTSYDGLPHGKNNVSQITENLAINIPDGVADEIREYERRIEEYQQLKAEILREISRLQLSQKSIIFDKYMNGLKWEQVAVRNHYTSRHCKNIRREAVECLVKYFGRNQTISNFKMEA